MGERCGCGAGRRRIWVVDNATAGLVPDAPGVEQAVVSNDDRPVADVAEVVALDDGQP